MTDESHLYDDFGAPVSTLDRLGEERTGEERIEDWGPGFRAKIWKLLAEFSDAYELHRNDDAAKLETLLAETEAKVLELDLELEAKVAELED
jgi:hypothetical protein|tara:strand:+ start:275569 stop:275844 length:276 start_codon:yes stop_codon:yes gene_type:complete